MELWPGKVMMITQMNGSTVDALKRYKCFLTSLAVGYLLRGE